MNAAVRSDERAMKLMAYADGELEGAELVEVESWIREDAQAVLFANDLAELGDLVKTGYAKNLKARDDVDIADAVMARVSLEKSAEKPVVTTIPKVSSLDAARAKKRNAVVWVAAGLLLAASVFLVTRNKEEAPLARTTSPLVQPAENAAASVAGAVDVENPGKSVSVIYLPVDNGSVTNVTTVVWVDESGGK